jgi:hypothetical protein
VESAQRKIPINVNVVVEKLEERKYERRTLRQTLRGTALKIKCIL